MKKWTPEKVGQIVGTVIFLGLVVAAIVAIISNELTVVDIVSWFMNAIGWWIIGSIVLVLAVLLVAYLFIIAIPVIAFVALIVGLILTFNGFTVAGVLCLVGGGILCFKISGWDDGLPY